jgi:hypothetical protein
MPVKHSIIEEQRENWIFKNYEFVRRELKTSRITLIKPGGEENIKLCVGKLSVSHILPPTG